MGPVGRSGFGRSPVLVGGARRRWAGMPERAVAVAALASSGSQWGEGVVQDFGEHGFGHRDCCF